jgi:tetratricopeptide (TPR) repeat protein
MIEVFKSLNRKMMNILKDKWLKDEKPKENSMDDKLRRNQIEEWLVLKNKPRVIEILNKELKNDDKNIAKLEELAFYQFKLNDFEGCHQTIMKILKNDRANTVGLYLLAYLAYNDDDFNLTITAIKCLLKIIPGSMEFLMILKKLYEDINYTAGVKFCTIYLKDSEFHPIFKESLLYPQIKPSEPMVKILYQQLNFKFDKFKEITKKCLKQSITEENFEVKIFNSIDALEECKFSQALKNLKLIAIDDDNEIILRILKGNSLYSQHNQWRAICEYEIAYNLCLKKDIKFPHIPALRCALWYLHDMRNTTKAQRYFHFCCKNYGTFNSWNGLGVVNLMEESYKNAEKYLKCANEIHKNCGGNWIYLALVNCKIKRMDVALKCYLTAKNCGVQENEILFEVERALQI